MEMRPHLPRFPHLCRDRGVGGTSVYRYTVYYVLSYSMSSLITSYTAQIVSSIGSYVPPLPRYSMSTDTEQGGCGELSNVLRILSYVT